MCRLILKLTLLTLLPLAPLMAAERINILLIYADDAGYADFGFQPGSLDDVGDLTPNINRIANEGALFTNAYMTGPVCSPSRAGLLTGRYQQRFGFGNNLPKGAKGGLSAEETTVATYLQALGYRTGLVGKWHLGTGSAYHPNRRGFDWFFGLLGGSRSYFPIQNPARDLAMQENGVPIPEKGYVTDRIGQASCSFLLADQQRPFFLMVAFTAPHGPLEPKPAIAEKLSDIRDENRRRYAGLLASMDENVGTILNCLQRSGSESKTLVIFSSDNGGRILAGADNSPLRGTKGDLLEGGIRVPLAMRLPGRIAPGTRISEPVIGLDFLPTFIEAAGGKISPNWGIDGQSLLARLTDGDALQADRLLFWRHRGERGKRAARYGKWKLLDNKAGGKPPQLYDLSNDIGERTNLATSNPETLKYMLNALDNWELQLSAPLWGPGSAAPTDPSAPPAN